MQRISGVTAQAKLRLERARADHGFIDVAVRTVRRYSEDDGGFYAASLTYYTFFSIFPTLIFAASILGYVTFLSREIRDRLLSEGLNAVPLISEILSPRNINSIQAQRGRLAVVGLVMALYAGSGAIVALEHALNKINRVESEPGFLQKRLRSLKWLASLALAAVVSVALGTLAQLTGQIFGDSDVVAPVAYVLTHLLGAALGVAVFLAAFKLLPATDQSWKEVLPGAIVAGAAFELLKAGGAWYLTAGARGRVVTFGAFKTAATLLVASYLLSQVTLLAAEVNAVLAERRRTRQSSLGTDKEAT